MSQLVEFVATGLAPRVNDLLQAFTPGTFTDAPRTVRAGVSLVSTLLFGGGTLYWFGGRLNDAVDASADSPLLSLLYGVMAYGFAFFLVGYAYSQLARAGAVSPLVSSVLVVVLAVFVLTLGGYGFAVAGAWLSSMAGFPDPWPGLVGLVAVSTVAWLLGPFVVGLAVWAGVAALGLGGPARRWVHASEPRPDAE